MVSSVRRAAKFRLRPGWRLQRKFDKVLGTSRHSNLEGLKEAYAVNLTAARNLGDPVASLQAISRVEQAENLSNPELRAAYDSDAVTYSATAPTAPIRTTASLSRAAGSPRHLNPWTH